MARKTPNPIDIHIGNRVRMRRMMLSMSQEKLGDAVGVTFQQIQKNEKGSNRIGGSRLQQIADVLQVTPAFFFEGAPSAAAEKKPRQEFVSPSIVSDFTATTDGLSIIKGFSMIENPKVRRALADLVAEIAGA